MKIFSASQIKKWDAYTIQNEPIPSSDLMERAAVACYQWIIKHNLPGKHCHIFCGPGNNGGDGLAIARLLAGQQEQVTTYLLDSDKPGTEDFQKNLQRLEQSEISIHKIISTDSFPAIAREDIVIDAIFGSGLSKPAAGIAALLINHINGTGATIISIDIPTGLFADKSSVGSGKIKANHTLSFQQYKLAFLLPENEIFCGDVQLLDIGLHASFEKVEPASFELIDHQLISSVFKKRSRFAHKGSYGHAALICGSSGMMGAAVLASLACLRSGAGKLTTYIPTCGYEILQATVPEAMSFIAGDEYILSAPGIEKFKAVGLGPGIGTYPAHKKLIQEIFEKFKKPMVIDADALNILAENKSLLKQIPPFSILTPHVKEFENLFGKSENDFNRLELALKKSKEFQIYIILKGHHSFIATPDGKGFFNDTGNPGMATAGSGDVLSGILTGLLVQGYSPLNTCLLGVFLHGLAGDFAAKKYSEEAMVAGDITACLGEGFKLIHAYS